MTHENTLELSVTHPS